MLLPDFEEEEENFPLLQRYGHLSEPVSVNRRISVPWCVLPSDREKLALINADKAVEALSGKKKEEEKPKPKVFSFFPWLWKFICFFNNKLGGK